MTSLPDRAAAVLGFLAAATVLAGLADAAGVFQVAGGLCARAAGGRTLRLWALVAALATVSTVLLSLDTAVVLVTPVVLAVCAQTGIARLPFAFLVVWLANTASLLLPVSNLTTLLAVGRLDLSATAYAARMALPEVVAVGLTVAWLSALHRREIRGGYDVPALPAVPDRVVFGVGCACCLALGPAVLLGAPPWAAATTAALVLAVATAARGRRSVLTWRLIPWRVLLLTSALFAVVDGLTSAGLPSLLRPLVGRNTFQTSAAAAALSNLVNNLPAYLALEPAVPTGGRSQTLALLIGSNVGPLILLSGSVATLLWREQCRRGGLEISARRFAWVGALGMPVILVAATAALGVG